MKYWWVNHKQTFKNEFEGGYIWSPHKNKNGSYNQTYENLKQTQIGDIIFSYADTYIQAIGLIAARCEESQKPLEFGPTGDQWDENGYLVQVDWVALHTPFKPKLHMNVLAPLLPDKYSPIQANGNGNQGCYLASIDQELYEQLISLIDAHNKHITDSLEGIKTDIEDEEAEEQIKSDMLAETTKHQLIKARVGQGLFKSRVINIEKQCRVTGVSDERFLIASHIKPWSKSSHQERLDGNNGLLLSPHVDRLFDKGWISFSDDGTLLLSQGIKPIMQQWKLAVSTPKPFSTKQQAYLQYHRAHIFRGAHDSLNIIT